MSMRAPSLSTDTFFKRSIAVAEYYGFKSVDDLRPVPVLTKRSVLGVAEHKSEDGHLVDRQTFSRSLEHFAEILEIKKRQPILFYTPSFVSHASLPRERMSALTLNIVGVNDPLSDIVVIKSALSILEELGFKKPRLRINSIGDRDSSVRFLREATNRIKQFLPDLPASVVEQFKTNQGAALAALYEERHPIIEHLPSPLEFLTSPSRKYFKELLELLEAASLSFTLDDKLYGDPSMYSHSLFEIIDENGATILARGGRYDALTKSFARSAVPSTGIVIASTTRSMNGPVMRTQRKQPAACIIHIGREARIRSISLIETFRKERIPIEQCLHVERFTDQLAYAELHKARYMIIMGQREAHDGVAIVRNTSDHSQRTMPIAQLTSYLRTRVS